MATYALIHGAASDAWYWHLVTPLLEARGHDVVAPDLPCEDDAATFETYADVVVEALDGRVDPIVVAQSLGGFTGPLVCERVPSRLLVMLAAMVPRPGESGAEWWAAVGFEEARRAQADAEGRDPTADLDPLEEYFHDVPDDVVAAALAHGDRDQSGTPMVDPWPLAAWPDVETRVLAGTHDRFFPVALQRRVAAERLGTTADEIATGHLPALARPGELVERLEAYRTAL